jgi:hypothetical protein
MRTKALFEGWPTRPVIVHLLWRTVIANGAKEGPSVYNPGSFEVKMEILDS